MTSQPSADALVQEAKNMGDGFTGGPDKRKRDGKLMAWCHYCTSWADQGHEDDCWFLLLQALLTEHQRLVEQARLYENAQCITCAAHLDAEQGQQMREALSGVVAEMRTIALVAGQCSVEGPQDTKALMAAAEAERASRWADKLEALASSSSLSPQMQEKK